MISFGPIPSRRLGKSLGINNITEQKICSYSCVYCQVGLTRKFSIERTTFYEPDVIYNEVSHHLEKLKPSDKPDYLTFVANGEPTLDINLGKSIAKLKSLGIPVAVITNASLLHVPEVRHDLLMADWVSVKIDANEEAIWKKINRPHKKIHFSDYLKGLQLFSSEYKGKLCTETMLIESFNDTIEILQATAALIKQINPAVAYISIPTRPPAIKTIKPPSEKKINEAYQIFLNAGLNAELTLGFEGTNTGYTGNAYEDILNICAVHPIREDTMQELLQKDNADYNMVKSMIENNIIQQIEYNSNKFYIRKLNN